GARAARTHGRTRVARDAPVEPPAHGAHQVRARRLDATTAHLAGPRSHPPPHPLSASPAPRPTGASGSVFGRRLSIRRTTRMQHAMAPDGAHRVTERIACGR